MVKVAQYAGERTMGDVAITGVSGHIAQILLPLLENDTALDRVIGIERHPIRKRYCTFLTVTESKTYFIS